MPFSDPLPMAAAPLIEWLDKAVSQPIVTNPEELTDERARLAMAVKAGRRQLVDDLKHKLKKEAQ